MDPGGSDAWHSPRGYISLGCRPPPFRQGLECGGARVLTGAAGPKGFIAFFPIGFGSFKIPVSPPFQRSHNFFRFFCPFLGIPFCSVGGPETDGEIYTCKNLILDENFTLRRAVPPTRIEN